MIALSDLHEQISHLAGASAGTLLRVIADLQQPSRSPRGKLEPSPAEAEEGALICFGLLLPLTARIYDLAKGRSIRKRYVYATR